MTEKPDIAFEKVEATGNLLDLQQSSDKVVRAEQLHDLRETYGSNFTVEELVIIAKDLFNELKNEYGVVAPVEFSVAHDADGEEVLASVVDRIEGDSLEDIEITDETRVQVKQLYSSIAKYFLDKHESGGYYLSDINANSQYMYGKSPSDEKSQIYLTDTDLMFSGDCKGIYLTVQWLTRHMAGIEKRCNSDFGEAREIIQKFLKQPRPEGLTEDEACAINEQCAQINMFLNHEKLGVAPNNALPTFQQSQ